jgi:hypothetical protein
MTPEAERLLNWHISELEGLLARCQESELARPLLEARLIEAYEALVDTV